ncbi:MAG: hypothetical protein ACREX0_20530 [Noviherbaspirillum sp.]
MKWMKWGTVLLVMAQVLIGGWAFMKMMAPANMLDVLRLFSLC